MAKKWYSYFIVTDEAETAPASTAETSAAASDGPSGAPRRVSEVAPDAATEPALEAPVSGPVDLTDVYESAKIGSPAHGYTVLKVAQMLESDHLQALPPEVKRKSILVALDAAGVRVDEIVEDAVRRDRALDTFERVLEKHLDQLRAQTDAENRQIEEEIARRAAELRARVDENRKKVEQEEREFLAWRTRKQQEEARIADAVGYFVSENPITSGTSRGA
jgi:hypothetical protein